MKKSVLIAVLAGIMAVVVLGCGDNEESADNNYSDYQGTMATIPAGEFMMGCVEGDSQCQADEKPRHKVYLDEFKIDKKEVTAGEFKQCVDAGKCTMPEAGSDYTYNNNKDNHPINGVDWNQAKAYCEWKGKRLPTEAEWEKAARGGTDTIYYCGNDSSCLDSIAWYSSNSDSQTHEVGTKKPNSYGLYDMLGNVWEWVADWYDENYYQSSPEKNPKNEAEKSYRVLRGGSWVISASNRSWSEPDLRSNARGFRCVSE